MSPVYGTEAHRAGHRPRHFHENPVPPCPPSR